MKSLAIRMFLNGIIIFIMAFIGINAQSNFTRNDDFDIQGMHELRVTNENSIIHYSIFSDSEFPLFKLHIKKSNLSIYLLPIGYWIPLQYKIHIDGITIQDWTTADEITISYNFPNPPNGISANHTYGVQVDYIDINGFFIETLSEELPITIFAKPRVYKDSDNNSFVQLRNEDATAKIPVLMVEGFDPLNDKFPENYYSLTWQLVNTDLYPNGYEVFILNFNDGGEDLRLNALVLLKALEKVHEICPNFKIALAGLSMGGPIGRYALAYQEQQGATNNVGMFLSYDSPQYGAHVNPGLQDWIYEQVPEQGAIADLQTNLQSIAAKQMLLYNTYDREGNYFNEFYTELNSLNGDGYPHQSYNVSVSNGNTNATYGESHVGRHLLTLSINENLIHAENAVPWDCYTGSKITDITTKRYGDIFAIPFLHAWYTLEFVFNPAYQPTWSSLDLYDANNLTKRPDHDSWGNLKEPFISKFDDFVVQDEAVEHHVLTERTRTTIMNWLDTDLNVTINYNSPEGGTINPDNYQFKILHPVTITVPTKTVTVNGKQVTYFFQKWEDGNTENPRTFFPGHNGSYTAIMKGVHLSNNAESYSNNGQRKFINLNGDLFITYASLGYVWLEKSTDNGASWSLLNNGKPIGNGAGYHPTMDYNPAADLLVIAYKSNSGPQYVVYHRTSNTFRYGTIQFPIYPEQPPGENPELTDAEPLAVAWNGNNNALFIINTNNIFYYAICNLSLTTTNWLDDGEFGNGILTSPTIYASKVNVGQSPQYFHFAYQKNGRDIRYRRISFYNTTVVVGGELPVSDGTGYTFQSKPTITETDLVNGETRTEYIRLAWVGYRNSYPDGPPDPCAASTGETRVIYKFCIYPNWYGFSTYGTNVNSVNINKGSEVLDDHFEPFAICWTEGNNCNYPNKYVKSLNLQSIRTLNTTGSYVQINNSTNFTNMFANSFNKISLPYYFSTSQNFSGGMEKIESVPISIGREGVVTKDSTYFYYAIGDISVDGQIVNFVEMADTILINGIDDINEFLVTEPFSTTDNSVLAYGVQYGITDSVAAVLALSDSSEINFRIELIDNQTGELLDIFDNVTYSSENVFQYDNTGYEIDLTGIGERELILKLVVSTNADCNYSISKRYSDSETINKKGVKHLIYNGVPAVTEYGLEQNYPNPFNPATIIRYQIPKAGNVTLKIYDILGSEVTTLINEVKSEGRYEVNFDASSLASGVYLYRLQVNDFVSTKKMILMK